MEEDAPRHPDAQSGGGGVKEMTGVAIHLTALLEAFVALSRGRDRRGEVQGREGVRQA